MHSAFDTAVCKRACSENSTRGVDDFVMVVQTIRE